MGCGASPAIRQSSRARLREQSKPVCRVPPFILFVDRQGRKWRVYEFTPVPGKTIYVHPGTTGAYRGFVSSDGEKRRYYISSRRPKDREFDRKTLQFQLELSEVDVNDTG